MLFACVLIGFEARTAAGAKIVIRVMIVPIALGELFSLGVEMVGANGF
jgi:hypothetical protein